MLRYACLVPFSSPESGPEIPPLPAIFDKREVLQSPDAVYPPSPESTCIVLIGSEASERAAYDALTASADSGAVVLPDMAFEKAMRDGRASLESVLTVLGEVDW